MYQKAISTYYGLSMFVVGTAVFAIYPSGNQELTAWQTGVQDQFATAWVEVIGDQPWFEELGMIYHGVESFYEESASVAINLFSDPVADQDIYYVFGEVYNRFSSIINLEAQKTAAVNYKEVELSPVPVNFMQEESLYNLIPYKTVVKTFAEGEVAGVSLDNPVNSMATPWVTLTDTLTGQLYCLGVFNGEVNQYLGPCKYDYQ